MPISSLRKLHKRLILYTFHLIFYKSTFVVYFLHFALFIFSHFDWIWCNRPEDVCVSVCVCHLYSPNGWTDLDESFHKIHLLIIYSIHFSPILKIQNWWRHGGHFNCFWFGHSHGRNFAHQQSRLITLEVMANCVFEKKDKIAAKNFFFKFCFT